MELAPELQFKHFAVRELGFPSDVFVAIGDVPQDEVNVCCDPDRHVYNPAHTDPRIVDALAASHWFSLDEWRTSGQGGSASY